MDRLVGLAVACLVSLVAMACAKHGAADRGCGRSPGAQAQQETKDERGCVKQLAVDFATGCALLESGAVWCWGRLPQDTFRATATFKAVHIEVMGSEGTALYLGLHKLCATRSNGELWCVGGNVPVQPGPRYPGFARSPVKHALGQTETLSDIDLGGKCAIDAGKLFCWKRPGDLDPHRRYHKLPAKAVQVVGGISHRCARLENGQVWCHGSNLYGALGAAELADIRGFDELARGRQPTHFLQAALPRKALDITAGSHHSCALTDDGGVWCWGKNLSGEVGNGEFSRCKIPAGEQFYQCTPEPVRLPYRVPGLPKVRTISAGEHSTCALDEQGKVWCWGMNHLRHLPKAYRVESGPVTRPHLIPLPVSTVAVETSSQMSCALAENRSVYCWSLGIDHERVQPVLVKLGCAK